MQYEVIYALPKQAVRRQVEAEPGVTARALFNQSGLAEQAGQAPQLGVYGRKVEDDYVMQRGDRLEVYRPLIADPKLQRRNKVEAKREQQRVQKARAQQHK